MAPTKTEEPAVLEPGTEVSARFNGAFCEAKIRTVAVLDVKIKVRDLHSGESSTVKHPNIITDFKDLRVQSNARVRSQNGGEPADVVVLQISDVSTYLVEFNDGDQKNLKRSSLHLKSGKHFDQSISLDNLPLTQPEKFSNAASASTDTPEEGNTNRKRGRNPSVTSGTTEMSDSDVDSVRRSVRTRKLVAPVKPQKGRPKKDKAARLDESEESSQTDKGSTEDFIPASVEKKEKFLRRGPKRARKDGEEEEEKSAIIPADSEVESDRPTAASTSKVEEEPVKTPFRRKGASPPRKSSSLLVAKESSPTTAGPEYPMRSVVCVPQSGRKKCRWLPALVVHPDCRKKPKIDPITELRVRLFTNSTYLKVRKDQVKQFSEDLYSAPEEDRLSKLEPDTALQYFKDRILPPTWQTTMFTPFELRDSPEDGGEGEEAVNRDDSDDESDATRFMIQWIKYRDASGHPDDTLPTIKGQAVDMYKLYRAVQHAGGFNRCNQEDKWEDLVTELDLPEDGALPLKTIYQNYLHGGFDLFFRTLATSIVDIRHGRNRHQHHVEKEPVVVVEPERHVQSPPPKRPRAASSVVPAKRGRGRPPARPKLSPLPELPSPPPVILKEKTPEVEEAAPKPTSSAVASTPATPAKRELSEESSRKSPTASDDEWVDIRKNVAPDAVPIPDTSVLKPGAVVEVLYRNQKGTKPWLPYPARILDNVGDAAYYVHYANWNKRYDEWKPLNAILKVIDLQEVGTKQYVPTSVFQNKIRSKLKNKEWDRYRSQMDRALAVEEATGTGPGPSAPTGEENAASKVELDEDQVSSKSSLETERRGRKRNVSKSETGKRAGSTGSVREPEPAEPSLELSALSGAAGQQDAALVNAEKEKRASPQPTTSRLTVDDIGRLEGEDAATLRATGESKSGPPKTSSSSKKPSVLIKVETVSRKAEKEKTKIVAVAEKKKKMVACAVVEERKSPPPKRMMRLAKFLPDVAKTKPAVVPTSIAQPTVVLAEVKTPEEPVALEMVAPSIEKSAETSTTGKNLTEKKISPDEEDEVLAAKPSGKRTRRKSTSIDSPKSGPSEVREKPVEEVSVVKKRAYNKKVTAKSQSKSTTSQSGLESSLPESSGKKSTADQAEELAAEDRLAVETPTISEVKIALPISQIAVGPTPLPALPVSVSSTSVEKDLAPSKLTTGARATPSKQPIVKVDSKPIVQPIVRPPLKRGRKPKQNRDADQPVDVVLKAPAFALEHKAALERLGLPLDGSESNKETIIEEDEFGNFARLVVEGVDLTDPDTLPGPALTGTARIETYEKNLNDSLLMMQLMIHRLATGYHVLRRCDSIRRDAREERKERERKNGTKKNDRERSESSEEEKASNAVSRGKNARNK